MPLGLVIGGVVLKALLPKVIEIVADAVKKQPNALKGQIVAQVSPAVSAIVKEDPQVKNALNQEPLWQSRVMNGALYMTVLAAANVWIKFRAKDFDFDFAKDMAFLAGSIYIGLARALPWSRPMWSRVAALFGKG